MTDDPGLAVHPRRVLHGPAAPDWRGEIRVGRARIPRGPAARCLNKFRCVRFARSAHSDVAVDRRLSAGLSWAVSAPASDLHSSSTKLTTRVRWLQSTSECRLPPRRMPSPQMPPTRSRSCLRNITSPNRPLAAAYHLRCSGTSRSQRAVRTRKVSQRCIAQRPHLRHFTPCRRPALSPHPPPLTLSSSASSHALTLASRLPAGPRLWGARTRSQEGRCTQRRSPRRLP